MWVLRVKVSPNWRCSSIVRNLELRREVEVEIGWIWKVKRLAEATMGKCQPEKRVSMLNIANTFGNCRKKSPVSHNQSEYQYTTWVSWGLLYFVSHNLVPLIRSRLPITQFHRSLPFFLCASNHNCI